MPERAALEAAAHVALAAWSLPAASVQLESHSENVAFRVDAGDGQRYVLRMHRPWYHNRAELESEHAFTAALHAAGVSTPKAARTSAGELYANTFIEPLGERREVGLLHWVDGDIMRLRLAEASAADMAIHYRRLGALCARMHAVASGWQPPPGFTRHRLDADGLAGETPFWGRFWEHPDLRRHDRQQLERARETLHARLSALDTTRGFSLIHADLHPGNVVLTEAGVHVIDFDDSGYGWHAYDLAVGLFEHAGEPDHAHLRDELLAGYESIGPRPDDIEKHIALFSAVRAHAIIGWLMQRPEITAGDLDQHVVLAQQLLEAADI